MAKSKEIETKPHYGPAMTPAIFCSKWLTKFRALFNYGDDHKEDRLATHPLLWRCHVVQVQWAHFTNFYSQAVQHSLTWADFPKEPEASATLDDPIEVQRAAVEPKVNPFTTAKRLQGALDVTLYPLRKCKEGDRVYEVAWRELPLAVRQRVNDILEQVAKAEEKGKWPYTDEYREGVLKRILEDERKRDVSAWKNI